MTSSRVDPPEAAQDAERILDAIEAAIPSMASRAADIAAGVFPEAADWDDLERRRFERQTAERFEAIMSVTRRNDLAGGDGIYDELADAGGAAAAAGAPLPPLLLTLRMSRDLMVQTAVQTVDEREPQCNRALAVVLTQVLPIFDRLTDSVTRGYWSVHLSAGT